MDDIVEFVIKVFLYIVFIISIPILFIVTTPFILLWPPGRDEQGNRKKRDIKGRYKKVWKIWESFGMGFPN